MALGDALTLTVKDAVGATKTLTTRSAGVDGQMSESVELFGPDGLPIFTAGSAALGDNQSNALLVPSVGARSMVYDGSTWDRATQGLTDTQLRATPVPVSGTVTADTELPAAAALSDTTANPTTPMTGSAGMVWNGTDWRRVKQTDNSGGSTGTTGIPITGIALSNMAGNSVALPSASAGDGLSTAYAAATAVYAYNGTTMDRMRGDVTNGLDVDVTRLSALVAGTAEIGKVQISDGTDVATVLPVRTVPATTEKSLNTVDMPTRLATYQCVTGEVAPAITIGVKELLNFFHPAAVTVDCYIVEIVCCFLVTTASTTGGRTTIEVLKSTSVGTGGTNLAAADVGGGLGTSAVITNAAANVMQVKTGGGTLGTAFIRQPVEYATSPIGTLNRIEVFKASSVGNGIIMRGGSADGINIQVNRVVAHTALVDQWTASIRWIEL